MKKYITLTIVIFATSLLATAQKFTKVASLADRGEGSVFIANDTVYFISGLNGDITYNFQSEMFDANTWAYLGTSNELNPLSEGLLARRGATAYYNDTFKTLYLIGGSLWNKNLGYFRTTTEVSAYSFTNKIWETSYLGNSETNRRYGQNAFVNSKGIYLIGGNDLKDGFVSDWLFASNTKEYSDYEYYSSGLLEQRILSAGVAESETFFYTAGGFDFMNKSEPESTLVKFFTTTKSSKLVLTDDAFKNYGGKAFKLGKYLYFFSGNLKSTMIKFDPTNNTFQELPNTLDPTKKYYGGLSFTHNGKVYFGGGYQEDENGNKSFLNDLYEVTEGGTATHDITNEYKVIYLSNVKVLHIETENTLNKEIGILDMGGQEILTTDSNENIIDINLQHLLPGVYCVKVKQDNGQSLVKKFVIIQ